MLDPRCLSQIVALADDDKIQVDRVFSLIAVKFVVADQPMSIYPRPNFSSSSSNDCRDVGLNMLVKLSKC